MEYTSVGQNVEVARDGKYLLIRVNMDEKGTLSASGKSMVVGSTRGNVSHEGVSIGLNVYKRR